MIFSTVMTVAFTLLSPVGSAAMILGDWLFNAFLLVKTVEYVVPNGPAIVGNVSQMIPVVLNILTSATAPLLAVNYTELVNDKFVNLQEYTGNITEYVLTAAGSVNDEL
jgi:hypothetical protein